LYFAFDFDDFESLLQNFGFVQTSSKFGISELAIAKVEKVKIAVT
jgi:hypothetical protein